MEEKKDTIIFQNACNNIPVVGIAERSFFEVEVKEAIVTEGIAIT